MNSRLRALLCLLAFLAAAGRLAAQQPRAAVWLLQPLHADTSHLPAEIEIGIVVAAPAYYTLELAGRTVRSGTLKQGLNPLALAAELLLADSGERHFVCNLLQNGQHTALAFTCRVERTEPRPEEAAAPNASVTVFVGGVQLASVRTPQRLQFDLKGLAKRAPNLGAPSMRDGTYPDLQRLSVPVLDIIGLLFKGNSAAKAKALAEAEAKQRELVRRREIVLKRADMPEGEYQVKIVLTLDSEQ
jgi:hypothetical protein